MGKNKKNSSKPLTNITNRLYNSPTNSQGESAIRKLEDYATIYEHIKFGAEFEEVVLEKDKHGQYHKWLRKMLSILDSKGHSALCLPQFETIKESALKLRAIRYPNTQRNPRVLFCFQGNAIIILHCFRESSKSEGTDYRNAVRIATGRLQEIQGK